MGLYPNPCCSPDSLPCPALPCPADQNLDAARPTDYDCRCFLLHHPRLELYRRIDGRVEEMVAGGLLKASAEGGGGLRVGRLGRPAFMGKQVEGLVAVAPAAG